MAITLGPDERRIRFDVFLSHNSKSKPLVREIKRRLIAAQLKVWFDEDELRPGIPWQELLEAGINSSKSVAVLVGADGSGPWENEEMQGALRLAVKDKRPVIPVLLPGCRTAPELPMFLGNRTWVDLRDGLTHEAFEKLLWGITGVKPRYREDTGPNHGPPVLLQPIPMQSPSDVKPVRGSNDSGALSVWREKLNFLQIEEAKASNPAQKFEIRKQIEEAKERIQDLGG